MTADKHAKRAARQLAQRDGISYTAARRKQAGQPEQAPPVLYPVALVPCAHDCDGTPHPGRLCREWEPEDAKVASFAVRQAADLPAGRARYVTNLHVRSDVGIYPGRDRARWLLALVYAMLTETEPGLAPHPAALRAAVEGDDLMAVEALMEPLDCAVARLIPFDPDPWWQSVKPGIDAYVARVLEGGGDSRVVRLAEQWERAFTATEYNMHGFLEADGVSWGGVKNCMDRLLAIRHNAYPPHARVQLADGRPAIVCAAHWELPGLPVAYTVRELVQGRYTEPGHLVPKFPGDAETVPAGDVLPWDVDRWRVG